MPHDQGPRVRIYRDGDAWVAQCSFELDGRARLVRDEDEVLDEIVAKAMESVTLAGRVSCTEKPVIMCRVAGSYRQVTMS